MGKVTLKVRHSLFKMSNASQRLRIVFTRTAQLRRMLTVRQSFMKEGSKRIVQVKTLTLSSDSSVCNSRTAFESSSIFAFS